jgi:AbrB family looped-hinge helix DNA binding protein
LCNDLIRLGLRKGADGASNSYWEEWANIPTRSSLGAINLSHGSGNHEIVRVDSKGRVTIPSYMREELGMREGAYASVKMNREDRDVTICLFAGAKARLVEIKMRIPDRPGALARVARTLSELNVDLLSSSSRTLKKGELAEWAVIADFSQSSKVPEDIRKRVLENRDAIAVDVKPFPG